MPFGTVSVPYTSQSADVRLESIEEQWPLYLDFAGQQAELPQHPSLVNTDAPFVPGTACTTTSCMHLDHLNGGCLVNIPLSPIDLGRNISA